MIDTFYLPGRVCSTKAIKEIAAKATSPYTMISLKPDIEWVYLGQERMIQVMEMTGAMMVYADRIRHRVADDRQAECREFRVVRAKRLPQHAEEHGTSAVAV